MPGVKRKSTDSGGSAGGNKARAITGKDGGPKVRRQAPQSSSKPSSKPSKGGSDRTSKPTKPVKIMPQNWYVFTDHISRVIGLTADSSLGCASLAAPTFHKYRAHFFFNSTHIITRLHIVRILHCPTIAQACRNPSTISNVVPPWAIATSCMYIHADADLCMRCSW